MQSPAKEAVSISRLRAHRSFASRRLFGGCPIIEAAVLPVAATVFRSLSDAGAWRHYQDHRQEQKFGMLFPEA